ncbi:MAG: ABC transporter ATP-binding protein [Evtepia sp.]
MVPITENKNKAERTLFGSVALGTLFHKWRDGTFRELLEDWRWILGFTKQYKWAVACYILLGVLSASFGLVSAVASKYTIDIITGYQTSKLSLVVLIMVASALVGILLRCLTSRVSTKISLHVNNDIQASIFDKVLDADWLALSKYPSGDVLNRFNSDVNTVAGNAISWLPNVVIGVYTFAATFCVILYYNVVMALIALASAPFLILSSRYFLRRMRRHNEKMKEMGSTLMAYETEAFSNLDTIKSFGLMDQYGRGLRSLQARWKKLSLDYNLFTIQTDAALSLLGSLVQFAAFGYCLYLLWTHQIAYGTMTLFLTQSTKLSSTFSNLVSLVPSFLNSAVSARRIRELVQLEKEPHDPDSGLLDPLAEQGFQVKLDSLTFAYQPGEPVIRKADFLAKPGEIVALVGPSGEGKTTLIRLILGLVRPGEGRAYFRGADGTEVAMNAETRRQFSYVPQGNTVLAGTIADNLRLVKEDATDQELEEALKLACAWEFVSQLPQGMHSPVGERGRGLSEGQAQRVAIARAILKDAPVLLLDEATSALDVATERQVLRNIIRSRPNKTCIVTTHRPSVLGLCQRVYRVSQGRVLELDKAEAARLAMDF